MEDKDERITERHNEYTPGKMSVIENPFGVPISKKDIEELEKMEKEQKN